MARVSGVFIPIDSSLSFSWSTVACFFSFKRIISPVDQKTLNSVRLYRGCSGSVSNVDRQVVLAAPNVLFGFGSGQVVAVDGCLGCLAPHRYHSYLCTGVPSRTVTSQHRSPAYPTSARDLLTGVDASCLADFGHFHHRFLWSPYGIGQTIIFLPCGFFFLLLLLFFLA